MEPWLMPLLQISDSSFPTGAFGHSQGLEYAIQKRWVHDRAGLLDWTRTALVGSLIPLDARACLKAWQAARDGSGDRWLDLDAELAAFRPSLAQRMAASQMGQALWEGATRCLPQTAGVRIVPLPAHPPQGPERAPCHRQYPTVWGWLCHGLGVPMEQAVTTLLHGTLRGWAQVALRIIPLGQWESFAYLGQATALVAPDRWDWRRQAERPLESLTPGWEIAQLGHENLSQRYFRS
jgi:urease accessory protein